MFCYVIIIKRKICYQEKVKDMLDYQLELDREDESRITLIEDMAREICEKMFVEVPALMEKAIEGVVFDAVYDHIDKNFYKYTERDYDY